jgi:hypothetical protein
VYRHVLILESQGFGSNQPQQLLGGSPKANPDRHISNTLKTLGKHKKVRLLSSPLQNQRFSQGFSRFWSIAWAFLHVHARACLQVLPK